MITAFGSAAVGVMFIAYWLEPRSKWAVLAFAAGAAATSLYSGLVEAYPVTVIEAVWAVVAVQRFTKRHREESLAT
jgi:hypothetical protein